MAGTLGPTLCAPSMLTSPERGIHFSRDSCVGSSSERCRLHASKQCPTCSHAESVLGWANLVFYTAREPRQALLVQIVARCGGALHSVVIFVDTSRGLLDKVTHEGLLRRRLDPAVGRRYVPLFRLLLTRSWHVWKSSVALCMPRHTAEIRSATGRCRQSCRCFF